MDDLSFVFSEELADIGYLKHIFRSSYFINHRPYMTITEDELQTIIEECTHQNMEKNYDVFIYLMEILI